jgi:hypothetical protein
MFPIKLLEKALLVFTTHRFAIRKHEDFGETEFLPRPLRIFWSDANRQFSFAANKKYWVRARPMATFGYIWLGCYIWLRMGYEFGYIRLALIS